MDPKGFRMHYKKMAYNKKYFHGAHKDNKKCPVVSVMVSLDVSSDMILVGGVEITPTTMN